MPPKVEEAFLASGFDHMDHVGPDAIATLEDLREVVGVSASDLPDSEAERLLKAISKNKCTKGE